MYKSGRVQHVQAAQHVVGKGHDMVLGQHSAISDRPHDGLQVLLSVVHDEEDAVEVGFRRGSHGALIEVLLGLPGETLSSGRLQMLIFVKFADNNFLDIFTRQNCGAG